MSSTLRPKLACHPCTVRKIKCNKSIPCDNCVKRGEETLCRRQEDHGQGNSLPDGFPVEYQSLNVLSDQDVSTTYAKNSKLVESLLWRVESLERALREHLEHGHASKSPIVQQPGDISEHVSSSPGILHATAGKNANVEAALVGERRDAQVIAPLWSDEERLLASNNDIGLATLESLLPSRLVVNQMIQYHIDNLLWMHNAFHAITFQKELQEFYEIHGGKVNNERSNSGDNERVQWVALLFSILSGSIISAPLFTVASWGYRRSQQQIMAEQWHNATIRCLELSRYLFNHSLFSIQAIATLTSSAYSLGFMRSQCVLMASGVRIAQGLGLHQLGDAHALERESATVEQLILRETKRRVWYTLVRQDYFFIPFSESYQVHRLFNNTTKPINCKEEDISPLNDDVPTITTYCRFLDEVALIMSELHDSLKTATTLYAQYEETLRFDAKMRALATLRRPLCFSSVPVDPLWPSYVTWGRTYLTISSSHKIIMIHRKFLGRSFTDSAFSFTRKTCIAAAKTILKALFDTTEVGQGAQHGEEQGRPVVWTEQAFSVTACVILCFDILYRPPGEPECAEHRSLIEKAILKFRSLDQYVIARKGIRLLRALLDEGLGGYSATIDHKRKRTQVEPDERIASSSRSGSMHPSTKVLKFIDVETFIQRFWRSRRASRPNNNRQRRTPHSTPPGHLPFEDVGDHLPLENAVMYPLQSHGHTDSYIFQGLFGEEFIDPLGGASATAEQQQGAMFWPGSSMLIDLEEPATLLIPPNTTPASTPSFEDLLFRAENFDF